MPPFRSTRIVPLTWQQDHRQLILETFRSMVRISRLTDRKGTRDPLAGRTVFAEPPVVYEGPARIQSRSIGPSRGPEGVADRLVTARSYLVAISTEAPEVKVDDLVLVLGCPDSPILAGLTLKVLDFPHADIAWQRSLDCDLYEPTARG